MAHHGIAPSEYWKMTPAEVWLLLDAKTPERMYGSVSESQLDSLYEVYQTGDFA